MDSILIMGGSTFVSSSLAKYLIKEGHIIDILTRGLKEIKYEGYRKHIVCNRKNKDELEIALENNDYKFIFDISAYTKQDVKTLLNCVNTNTLDKYIFCSSGAVYKESKDIINEEYEVGENIHWGKYGLDKKEAEDCIINSDIPYAIFRPTYIYGDENNLYREGYFFDRIKEKKIIPVPYGNNSTTQFVYIKDILKVFESAMYSGKNKGIYNVTNPEIVSFEYLINNCSLAVGEKSVIKDIESSKYEVRTYFPFRDVTYMLSIEKLISDKLYVPKTSLKEGLEKSYKWYVENNIKLSDNRMSNVEDLTKDLL